MNKPKPKPTIEECDFCGFETSLEECHDRMLPEEKVYLLCDICRCTLFGNALSFPGQYENIPIMKGIAYIGNAILKAIKEKH